MGTDIFMKIVSSSGKTINPSVYELRNSEWFDELQGKGYNVKYDYFPALYYDFPEVLEDFVSYAENNQYYGFHYLTVGEFKKWFRTYEPYIYSGWVHKFDKVMYDKYNIYPGNDSIRIYLDEDCIVSDWEFGDFNNQNDPIKEVWQAVNADDVLSDDYIIYYFG